MTPAEHDALARVVDQVMELFGHRSYAPWPDQVEDTITRLRRLVADPGTRPVVLVALGLGGGS